MPTASEHSALGRWVLKKVFKIDIDDLASEQRASYALLDAANKHKTQLDAAVAAKETQITDLLQQIEASKANLSSAVREIDQLKQDHEAKQHTLNSLEGEKVILQSNKDDLEALIKELEITIKQREVELAEVKSMLESQQADTAKKEKQIAGLKGDIESFLKLKKQLTSENAKLEGKSGRLTSKDRFFCLLLLNEFGDALPEIAEEETVARTEVVAALCDGGAGFSGQGEALI